MTNYMCSIEGCFKPMKARGYCSAHWERWYQDNAAPCSIEGCSKPRHGRSLMCKMHETRVRRTGSSGEPESRKRVKVSVCVVADCANPTKDAIHCSMHEARLRRHGDVSVVLPRGTASGPDNPHWTGDEVGYLGMHDRLYRSRGRASEHQCPCGNRAKDWSYSNECQEEKRDEHGAYCVHVDCYEPLCASCHKIKDLQAA
jgi:hypothetical protein